MKITNLSTHLLTARWIDDPWFPHALHATAIVRVETDNQLDGLGEITLGYFAPDMIPAMVEYFKPVILGGDPMNITHLARAMFDDSVFWARSGAGRSVLGGIEMALWDLKGKALKVPVYQLLGGAVRERIPVYASGGPTCWPIEETVKKVAFYASNGYRATKLSTEIYKLTPPSAGAQLRMHALPIPHSKAVETLVEAFERLRKEFGSDMDFAIDGHQGGVPNPIPVSEAVEIDEAMAPFRLRFYEEPLAYTNLDGYRELRARSHIPIAGGESLSGLDQFHGLIGTQAVHLIQPDLGFMGGVHETVRTLHHADAYSIGAAIHTGAAMGPALAASWHVAAATGSVRWLEHVVSPRSIQRDLMIDHFQVRDGTVGIPHAPGLGVQLTPALLERYRFVPNTGERT